jgi:hypothetical protein
MTRVRCIVGLAIVITVTCLVVRLTSRTAQAAPAAVIVDPFGEEESARRFAASQPRHWRQVMMQR